MCSKAGNQTEYKRINKERREKEKTKERERERERKMEGGKRGEIHNKKRRML